MDMDTDTGCEEDGVYSDYDNISFSDVEDLLTGSSSSESEIDQADGNLEVTEEGNIQPTQLTEQEATNEWVIDDEEKQQRRYFLTDTPLLVKILETTYQPRSHILNPYLYTIEITHGSYKWTIKRRCRHFHDLHRRLEMARAVSIVRSFNIKVKKVPRFPHRPESTIREQNKEKRMERLEKFLQEVLDIEEYRNDKHTLDFLEISSLSFMNNLGGKNKEGEVLKRVGGHTFNRGVLGIGRFDPTWHNRWLVLKQNFVTYLDKDENEIREVMLFDKNFRVDCDHQKTGIDKGLLISNSTRNLTVQCFSNREAREWVCDIAKLMSNNEYMENTRYDSFSPVRQNAKVKWYADGKYYFSDVADAILTAEEEIFITDWWLSPELSLNRSMDCVDTHRLDKLLKTQADKGVKIYVLLYKEIELSLGINSAYSKKTLSSLNAENIMVLRHPDHVGSTSTLLWAHHEKIVCIDQKICFLGGFDLCFGRWDDHNHRLTDVGSATPSLLQTTDSKLLNYACQMALFNADFADQAVDTTDHTTLREIFIGKDYTNPYVADVSEVESPFTDYLDRNKIPRMPWHDIACVVSGDPARDAARHFIQRWNFTKQEKAKDRSQYPYLLPKIEISQDYPDMFEGVETCDVQILRSASEWSCGSKITDKSICNAYLENIKKSKYYIYIENQFFITSLKDTVMNEIGEALVERILQAHQREETFRVFIVMPLLPSFPGEIGDTSATATCFVEYWNLTSSRNIITKLEENGIQNPFDYIFFCGLRNFADLHSKKVTEIVYVHSKLMIVDDRVVIMGSANVNDRSMLGVRDSEIAVCVEDTEMIRGKMNHVDVDIGSFASSLRIQLFKEHLGLLKEPFNDLPTNVPHDELTYPSVKEGCDVTQLEKATDIQVNEDNSSKHTDIALPDDEVINEAVTVTNSHTQNNVSPHIEEKHFNHEGPADISDLSSYNELVTKTFSVIDPICDEFYKHVWIHRAKLNSEIYEKVFRCLPTNEVYSFQELATYRSTHGLEETDPNQARLLLEKVCGFLVEKPLDFLSKQDLWPETGTKESLVPTNVFT